MTVVTAGVLLAQGSDPARLFEEARARETALRAELDAAGPGAGAPLLRRLRILIGAYQDLTRLFPTHDVADDALWQGSMLAADVFRIRGDVMDRQTALVGLERLAKTFPSSPFAARIQTERTRIAALPATIASAPGSPRPETPAPPVASRSVAPAQTERAAAEPPPPTSVPPIAPAVSNQAPPSRAAVPAASAQPVRSREDLPSPQRAALAARDREAARAPAPRTSSSDATGGAAGSAPLPAPVAAPALPVQPAGITASAVGTPPRPADALVTAIRQESRPETDRVVIELDREAEFSSERLTGPARVFVDLVGARIETSVRTPVATAPASTVRSIRIGRHADRTRVVLDLASAVTRHSVYALYDPYRIVVDVERPASGGVRPSAALPSRAGPSSPSRPAAAVTARTVAVPLAAIPTGPSLLASRRLALTTAPAPALAPGRASAGIVLPIGPRTAVASGGSGAPAGLASPTAPAVPSAPPTPPRTNTDGSFSLARQLGLGISRVVIDPGHGGHDPGAKTRGLTEAELVLDVALRLERLLLASGIEVVLTRRSDVYVPLEERTAIANRADADLFLSIHVNASAIAGASGVESYYLNFAGTPAAERVAARENAASARRMRELPALVRALAQGSRRDESRDLAVSVQAGLFRHLRQTNRTVRNLGVKQAPFMVLLGATMPAALIEVAFLSNREEATRLRTGAYRDALAAGLHAGLVRYQQSVKRPPVVATR